MSSKVDATGMSLVVLWLRLCTSSARGVGLMPGWGTNVPHAVLCSQNFFFNFLKKALYGKRNNYKAFGELKSTVRNCRRILIMLISMNPSEF